jgi:prolyl 4-hydroxylase
MKYTFLLLVLVLTVTVVGMRWGIHESFFDNKGNDRLPYRAFEIPRLLTAGECQSLIHAAEEQSLEASKVHDGAKGERLSEGRTSKQTWLQSDHPAVGPIVRKLMETAASVTGIRRADMMEHIQVARYLPNQKYDAHYDACVKRGPECEQAPIYRRATLLVYLTDDFKGGETEFPKVGIRVQPQLGKGVLFYNTDPDTGIEIDESFHAGLPVTQGVKWIANVWMLYDPALYDLSKNPATV